MEKKKNNSTLIFIVIFVAVIVTMSMSKNSSNNITKTSSKSNYYDKSITILASQENKPLEKIVKDYAETKNYDVQFEYAGTLEIVQILNENSSNYDAVWLSNSIWGYMLDSTVKLTDSKCTSINPVVFGIKKSKAQELGFIDKTVYTKEILDAISNKKFKFSMPNPTTTNSGASCYLGLISTLAGNPEVLTEEMLQDENLKQQIKTLFTGLERSSGSEDFLEELFLNGDYEAVVSYESSIININKQLTQKGQEPLYAIYPVDRSFYIRCTFLLYR